MFFWRATLGAIMLVLVLVFPDGIAGGVQKLWHRLAHGNEGAKT